MSRQSIPASDALKAKLKAPKFTPIAMLYTVPQNVRSDIGMPFCLWISCHAWMTRDISIVVPIFVPANCVLELACEVGNLCDGCGPTYVAKNYGYKAHSSDRANSSSLLDPVVPAMSEDRNPAFGD
jgi:hypothetical protein